jgi:GAF domain-containing protein
MTIANRFNQHPDNFERRARNAFWVSGVFFLTTVVVMVATFVQTLSNSAWQLYGLGGFAILYCLLVILSLATSQKHPERAMLTLTLGGGLAIIAAASLLAHVGVALAFILVATTVLVTALTLNKVWGFRVIVTAAAAALIAIVLHYFAPVTQLSLDSARTVILISYATLLIPLIVLIASQYAHFTLRTKLILLCIIVALIPLAFSLQLNFMIAKVAVFDPVTAMISLESIVDNALLTGLVIMALAALLALWALNALTGPIKRLQTTVDKLKSGNFYTDARIESNDEIGTLALTINQMTDQLRGIWVGLEQRTADRTRASALSAAVSRRLATVTDQNQLLTDIAVLVREAFSFYHVQICLFDQKREHLVIAGGTGEIGQMMLEQGYQVPAGQGPLGRSASQNQVVHIADVSRDPNWLPNPLLPDTKVELVVPIALGERVMGVFDIHKNTLGNIRQEDIELIQSMGSQMAIALRNAQSLAQTQALAGQIAVFNSISRKIHELTDPTAALQTAAAELGSAFKGARVNLRLANDKVLAPANSEDTISAPFSFPINVYGEPVAEFLVEGLTNLNEANSLLTAVTTQLSLHLEKLRLNQQAQAAVAEAQALSEAGGQFNQATTLSEILQAAAAPAITGGANDALLFIFDPDPTGQPEWMEVRANWVREGSFAIPVGVRFFAASHPAHALWLTESGAPAFVGDIQTDPRLDPNLRSAYNQLDVQATAFLPLLYNRAWIGLMIISWAGAHPFNDSEVRLYQALAAQASLAVHHHLLLGQTRAAVAESDQLYQASRSLTSATALQDIVADVASNLPIPAVNRAVLLTLAQSSNGEAATARVISNWHSGRGAPPVAVDSEFVIRIPANKNIFLQTEPSYFDDAQLDSSIDPGLRAIFAEQQVRGLAVLPLWSGSLPLGCLLIVSEEAHHFTESEIRPFGSLAQQMAVVMENRHLLRQSQEAFDETETLYKASALLNSATSTDEALQALIQTAINNGAVSGGLLKFELDSNAQPQTGIVAASWDRNGRSAFPIGTRFKLADFSIAQDWINHPTEPIFISDVIADQRVDEATAELYQQLQARSAIWLPLSIDKRWVGLAYVSWREPREFSAREQRLFESLSGLAATILEKFLLLEKTRKRAERETVINLINQKIQSATSINGAVETAVRELGQALKARRTVVELAENGK